MQQHALIPVRARAWRECSDVPSAANNQTLQDDNTSQALDQEAINELKRTAASGEVGGCRAAPAARSPTVLTATRRSGLEGGDRRTLSNGWSTAVPRSPARPSSPRPST